MPINAKHDEKLLALLNDGTFTANLEAGVVRYTGDDTRYVLRRVSNKGYRIMNLRSCERGACVTTFLEHRAVCIAAHGMPPTPQHQVNHKDGNKQNNKPDNLEWVTPQQNSHHAVANKLHGGKLLTAEQADCLRADRAAGMKFDDLGRKYGVSTATAWHVGTGRKYA